MVKFKQRKMENIYRPDGRNLCVSKKDVRCGENVDSHQSVPSFRDRGRGKERQKSLGVKELRAFLSDAFHFGEVGVRITPR